MTPNRLFVAFPLALLLSACSPGQQDTPPAAPAAATPDAMQAAVARLQAEGPLPSAREASHLEYWLHYKLMQANGVEQALGGEAPTIAALKAFGLAVERSALVAQRQVPKMVPMAFDGTGIDAGMMGAGYGLVGGALTGSLVSGGLSDAQVAQAAQNGPIKFDGDGGSAQMDIAQDGMRTTLEQTVNENGVTGKVKTEVRIDACPDATGKLTVTLETTSTMGAGGKRGAVTLRYRQERWLDDDAHLVPIGSGDQTNASEFFQIDMKGDGANGPLSYYQDTGFTPDGKPAGGSLDYSGYSIFRPAEAAHTEKMVAGTQNLMRAFAQMMLQGSFSGGKAPWESGRCVDLKLRSTPDKRTGAKPDTRYTVFAEPRAKKDGMPTGGTVRATLKGTSALDPQGKVKADATFDYRNPAKKGERASIDFEARSKRGVGKATLEFDTKKSGYRVTGGSDPVNQVVCGLDAPFVLNGKLFGAEFTGGMAGSYALVRTPNIPGLQWKGRGTYTIVFPDGEDKPGRLTTQGGGSTTAGDHTRQTTGDEHFTLTPVDGCESSP